MKKTILTTVLILLLLALLVGCQRDSRRETNAETYIPVESYEDSQEDLQPVPQQTRPAETAVPEPIDQPSLEERFSQVRVEVLARTVVPYEDGAINGYLAYGEGYDKATILTLGLTFPDWDSSYECGGVSIVGETATDAKGDPVPQTSYGTSWMNSTLDQPYAIMIRRVAGEVDASKARVRLKQSMGSVSAEVPIQNHGDPVGFSHLADAFPTQVKRLQGRTYMIVRRYWSSYSASGDTLTDTVSFVLVPLEGGLGKTLDASGMRLFTPDDIRATSGELLVNINSAIDASTIDLQSTIELAITRELYEERGEDGYYPDEVFKEANKDMNDFADASYVEIDDGSGNTVTLRFGD